MHVANIFLVSLWVFTAFVAKTTFAKGKTALIIIDVQNCFTPGGSLAVADGDDVIPIINNLRTSQESHFDLTVRSQDWHCPDHVSFASQHPGYSPLNSINLSYDDSGQLCTTQNVSNEYTVNCTGDVTVLSQTLWQDHCVINTTDADFHKDLVQKADDIILQKGFVCYLDSYSVFYDNGRYDETPLRQLLEDHGVTSIYITGLATDYCVYWSAKDGKELGFETYVILDATKGIDPVTTKSAIEDMESRGVTILNSTDLLDPESTSEATRTWFSQAFILLYAMLCLIVCKL